MVNHVVLIVPGLGNSGEDHWQSIWQRDTENFRRVQQDNWNEPDFDTWVDSLARQITAIDDPVFLVAHSVGCALVAHWAARHMSPRTPDTSVSILGAFLVSPADVDSRERAPPEIRDFAPMPLVPLRFPSIVVASEDDPYVSEERAQFFAECWGSEFVSAGPQGHINANSGHGPWVDGSDILNEFIAVQTLHPRTSPTGAPRT